MKRYFILTYNFLNELLSRLNEVISVINVALLLSHDIRRNVELIILIVKEHVELRINGYYLRNYRPDYESASGLLKRALTKGKVKGITFRRIRHDKIHVTSDMILVINHKGVKPNYILDVIREKKCREIAILLPNSEQYIITSNKCMVYHINMSNFYTTDQIITILNILLDTIGD